VGFGWLSNGFKGQMIKGITVSRRSDALAFTSVQLKYLLAITTSLLISSLVSHSSNEKLDSVVNMHFKRIL
jgi:hypothetical protein